MKAEISPTQPAQSLETPKFTWVPFFAELAQRLLDFRSDRARLIAILQGIEAQGLPMALLGKWTSDIDPFTFLAAINRDLTPQNRKKIAMSIAEALELECPAPTDYDGIPVFSSLKARLVGDDSLECDNLWTVLEGALGPDPLNDPSFGAAVDKALAMKGVANNLFIALFWVRPRVFLPTDQHTRLKVKDHANLATLNFAGYVSFVRKVAESYDDFVDLSRAAWLENAPAPAHHVPDGGPPVLGEELPPAPCYWFVGAMWPGAKDRTDDFLESGEWIVAWPKGIDKSSSEYAAILQMRPGERIAIKAAYVRKLHLPFETGGKPASVMAIKATGTIKHNPLDGVRIAVDWDPKPAAVREWYFYTNLSMLWKIGPDFTDFQKRLISFTFDGESQDYDEFLADPYWRDKYVPSPGKVNSGDKVIDGGPTPDRAPAAPPYTIQDAIEDGVFLSEKQLDEMLNTLKTKLNIILQGPPGTGKTYLASKLAAILAGTTDGSRIHRVQFHQTMSYEDFVLGLRPKRDGRWEMDAGHFVAFANAAELEPSVPHVLIIEEINRGNPSAIFGELLTLIESDKRHSKYAIRLRGAGEGKSFFVPPNLHIIGTMNRADRSLAPLDHALRRRFAFFDLQPHFGDAYFAFMQRTCEVDVGELEEVISRVQKLNAWIAKDLNLGSDCTVGHSYFCNPPKKLAGLAAWFEGICKRELLPLLQEYWFGAQGRERLDTARHLLGVSDAA